jgi:hypothetical protein
MGMDFNPGMKHQLIRKTVREFAENEIRPLAAEMDKGPGFPDDLMEKMKPLHYFGLQVPMHLGGADLDSISYAIVIEEISRVSAARFWCLLYQTWTRSDPVSLSLKTTPRASVSEKLKICAACGPTPWLPCFSKTAGLLLIIVWENRDRV